ncbi:hypothetical protein OEZ86_001730 [Tetradesmus obliquus]|nr:hypothetical protein OEZ86_001730 [Tetradesmus obliquus]
MHGHVDLLQEDFRAGGMPVVELFAKLCNTVATLARLLVWLQQRPELLLLPSKQAAEDSSFADQNWVPYCSC